MSTGVRKVGFVIALYQVKKSAEGDVVSLKGARVVGGIYGDAAQAQDDVVEVLGRRDDVQAGRVTFRVHDLDRARALGLIG